MINLIGWLFFGIVVGAIAKRFHPGEEPVGWIPTIAIGVCGSYFGGFLYWLLFSLEQNTYRPAGFLFSILGGVLFLCIFNYYVKSRNS